MRQLSGNAVVLANLKFDNQMGCPVALQVARRRTVLSDLVTEMASVGWSYRSTTDHSSCPKVIVLDIVITDLHTTRIAD